MSKKAETTEQVTEVPVTLEETFDQIEEIIAHMETPEVTLDESFRLYQEGIEKLKNCNQILDQVEKKMQILNSNGELEDF